MVTRVARVLALVLGAQLWGCWAETQTTKTTTVTIGQRAELRGRRFVDVVLDEEKGRIWAEVSVARSCERWDTVEERSVVEIKTEPTGFAFVGPAVLMGAGLVAESSRESGPTDGAGLVMVGVGVGVAALILTTGGTQEKHLPPEQKEIYAGKLSCLKRPVPGVDVVVRGEAGELAGRTDGKGVARLEGDAEVLKGELEVFVDGRRVREIDRRDKEWRPAF